MFTIFSSIRVLFLMTSFQVHFWHNLVFWSLYFTECVMKLVLQRLRWYHQSYIGQSSRDQQSSHCKDIGSQSDSVVPRTSGGAARSRPQLGEFSLHQGCRMSVRLTWYLKQYCLFSLASLKSRLVWPFWCRLTQVVLEKKPLKLMLSVIFIWQTTNSYNYF